MNAKQISIPDLFLEEIGAMCSVPNEKDHPEVQKPGSVMVWGCSLHPGHLHSCDNSTDAKKKSALAF